MAAFKPFILGSLLGAAAVYVSLQYHVVHSDDGFYLVPRAPQASMGLAYADIRNMSNEEIAALPELSRAMSAQEARKLLASSDSPSSDGSSLLDGTDLYDEARERLQSSDDWNSLNPAAIPKLPGTSPEAPIWNPFQEQDEPAFLNEATDDSDSIPWPELQDESDPVASEFDVGDSPFADITEAVANNDSTSDSAAGFEDAIENVADELDKARDSFASRTRQLADQFQNQSTDAWSQKPDAKPFDFTAQPTYTTNRVQAPVPLPQNTGSSTTSSNRPIVQDQSSLTRRARELYEGARRRASQPIDSLIDRAESRASSVIDELVSPRESEVALDRAATSTPSRYTRPQR
jgi:hypothetical protein